MRALRAALRLTGARCARTRVHPSFWVVERENAMVCATITRASDARDVDGRPRMHADGPVADVDRRSSIVFDPCAKSITYITAFERHDARDHARAIKSIPPRRASDSPSARSSRAGTDVARRRPADDGRPRGHGGAMDDRGANVTRRAKQSRSRATTRCGAVRGAADRGDGSGDRAPAIAGAD